jgi:hypothetical protein
MLQVGELMLEGQKPGIGNWLTIAVRSIDLHV